MELQTHTSARRPRSRRGVLRRLIVIVAAGAALAGMAACSSGGSDSSNSKTSDAGTATSSGAPSSSAKVALILSQPEGDPFGDLVYSGLQRLNKENGTAIKLIAATQAGAYEQQVRSLADQGYNPVMVLWDDLAAVVEKIAPSYPKTNFVILDSYSDPKQSNVETVVIDPTAASYVAGVVAATESAKGKIGFVGGQDVPVITKYLCGFQAGVKATKPDYQVLVSYAGTFTDPQKGQDMAKAAVSQGADVIMQAANQTGLGVLKGAAAAGVKSIGVDMWQGDVAKGVIWSALKDAGTATYDAALRATTGKFQSGLHTWGAAEGATLYDQRDFAAASEDVQKAVTSAADGLKSGSITLNC